jgi:mono/diheme cytochrome c family protein
MVASTAFVLGFIVLGLAVLFFAFGGGPRGARAQLHSQSRGGARAVSIGVGIVALLIGIGVPALVMASNNDTQSKKAPGGVKLSDAEQHGRTLFARNCNTCHTLKAAHGAGKVGPNLDVLISGINGSSPSDTIKNRVTFIEDAIKNGRARGSGQMPAELLDGQDAKNVAGFVAKVAGR